MKDTWKLQDAKNRFSELVERTRNRGPQRITRRGKPVAVVVSEEEYERLAGGNTSLAEFFRDSPLAGIDLDLARDRSPGRKVVL
jgi:antitoxin Phd